MHICSFDLGPLGTDKIGTEKQSGPFEHIIIGHALWCAQVWIMSKGGYIRLDIW